MSWLPVLLSVSVLARNYQKRIDSHLESLQQVISQLEAQLAAQQGEPSDITRADSSVGDPSIPTSQTPPPHVTPTTSRGEGDRRLYFTWTWGTSSFVVLELEVSLPLLIDTFSAPDDSNQGQKAEEPQYVQPYSPPPDQFSLLTILKFVPLFLVTTLAMAASVVLGNIVGW